MIHPETLSPTPDSETVTLVFDGGPRDGGTSGPKDASELLGSIKWGEGTYQLVGFRKAEAIYLWTN